MIGLRKQAWHRNEPLREALETAGWRYAILIGITQDDSIPAATLESDAQKYGSYVRKCDAGRPIWDCKEATTFVSEVTGASREASAAWLDHDWNGGGEV